MQQQIEVPATWESIAELMKFSDAADDSLGLTADQSYLLRLVVEEIATNIVKYGYDDSNRDVIQLSCRCDDGLLTISIRDRGKPFDPRDPPDPDLSDDVESRSVGGLGLFLVRESADELHYHHDPLNGWNELIVTKKPFTLFERLRQFQLFKSLSDEDLTALAEQISERKLAPGEVLYQEGDEGHECAIILSGSLDVLRFLGGEEIRLETFHAGKIIGEMALIDRSPRSATVRASNNCDVAILTERDFHALMRSDPDLAMSMLRDGTSRLRTTNQRMIGDLEAKNAALSQAYQELKAAQGELIRLNRIEQELSVARTIQASFLPRTLAQPQGWQVAAYSRGAQAVGGDFYDCIELPGARLGLVVADACGKGVTAALFVALTRSLLRAASQAPWAFRPQSSFSAEDVLTGALWLTNDYMTREHGESNMFTTAFYGVLDPQAGGMAYVNAGHNPPLLVGKAAETINELEEVAALPLGIFASQDFPPSHTLIGLGESFVAFSDGITEAMNGAGEPFGDERLHAVLRAHPGLGATALVETIVREVDSYVAGAPQADDMTLLIVSRNEAML